MSNYEIAQEVISGKWGNGQERRQRLTYAGFDYDSVQSIVNALMSDRPVSDSIPEKNPLEIDYDIAMHNGVVINIII